MVCRHAVFITDVCIVKNLYGKGLLVVHAHDGLRPKKTLWPLVRKRTIPTERPPLVGEVSANFCG
jgi:hypothetical protein